MNLLETLAEQRISEARDRGDLEGLPNEGRPLELDDDSMVPPSLRAAYRVLKNAGYLPEELQLRREIHDAEELLRVARTEEERATAGARLRLLLHRLGSTRGDSLMAQEAYYQRIRDRIQREDDTVI
jgi:hypothetical protein